MTAEADRSTWRSAQGRALRVWIAVGLLFWLGVTRLLEVIGKYAFYAWAAVFLLAPVVLTVWAILRARRGAGSWEAVWRTISACLALAAAGFPLSRASVHLNFWAHRAAYDAVVADIKAGRLAGQPVGRRHGVTYNAPMMRAGDIGFVWYWDYDIGQGVAYDEEMCPPPAAERRDASAEPLSRNPDGADPPTIKGAGLGYKFHLGGHYCYFSVP